MVLGGLSKPYLRLILRHDSIDNNHLIRLIDIVVNPEYRRRGIGKQLYELRKGVARRFNKKGIISGGHIGGYAGHKHHMSAAEYVDKVAKGEHYHATLTFQLGNGFEVRGVLADYLEEEAIDNWAALIVWENPDYRA